MRRLVRLLLALPLYPFRLYRRRISVQLIFSHLLVVLMTALLLGALAVALTVGTIAARSSDTAGASAVIDQGRLLSTLIPANDIAEIASDGVRSPAYDRAETTLSRVMAADLPTNGSQTGQSSPEDLAAVVDRAGQVIVSSKPGDGQLRPIEQAASPLLAGLTRRAIQLNGQPNGYGNPYLYDSDAQIRAVVFPILGPDGKPVGYLAQQRFDQRAGIQIQWTQIFGAAIGVGLIMLVTLSIPALLIAAPVGIWRARAFSKRLARLASAADAMTQGDLSRRIVISGEDEISRLSERFNVMAASIQGADRARKSFVANVSHELRTPTTVVQGRVERLIRSPVAHEGGMSEADGVRHELEVVRQEMLTLSRLVDDLFTLARLEEAVLPVEPRPVAVGDVAREAVESLKGPAWDQRKVTVQSLVPPDLSPVLADPTRLRQILRNLLYNALRYTPEGGLIVVDARHAGTSVEVSVTDTGIDIASEDLDLIFQRFYRSPNGATNDEGSGLGLAVVKQLVEAQGGSIAVESHPNEGTIFRFTLPVAT